MTGQEVREAGEKEPGQLNVQHIASLLLQIKTGNPCGCPLDFRCSDDMVRLL